MTREEAIKIVQSATVWTGEERDALVMLIPELAESEDERIRKGMIDEIKAILRGEDLGFPPQDVLESRLAYLEKQKEKKPAEVDVKALLTADRLASAEMTGRLKERSEILENPEKYNLCKSTEWSKEDEMHLNNAILAAEKEWGADSSTSKFLKSLRPQPHWKPSEEQIDSLDRVIRTVEEEWNYEETEIRKLLEDLKKL